MKTATPVPFERVALKELTASGYTAVEAAEKTFSLTNRSEEEVAEAGNEFRITRVRVCLAPEGMPKDGPTLDGSRRRPPPRRQRIVDEPGRGQWDQGEDRTRALAVTATSGER